MFRVLRQCRYSVVNQALDPSARRNGLSQQIQQARYYSNSKDGGDGENADKNKEDEIIKREETTKKDKTAQELIPAMDDPDKLPKVIKKTWLQRRRENFQLDFVKDAQMREVVRDTGIAMEDWAVYKRDAWDNPVKVPSLVEVLVVGGGIMGMSTAYWIATKFGRMLNVAVLEKDPTYQHNSTVASVGGLRQQFSLPENIRLSLYTAEFFRDIKNHLTVLNIEPPDVQFQPMSYVFLASESGVETMRENHATQIANGAKVELLEKDQLKQRFPWMNVDDIALASSGLENEGCFDPHLLLAALKSKCLELGVQFINGEVVDVALGPMGSNIIPPKHIEKQKRISGVMLKATNGDIRQIKSQAVFNCAGPQAGAIGRMAGIGTGEGVLSVGIPVEPRKRYVYVLHCPDGPGLDTPFLVDNSGVYLRREGYGGTYLCGASPPEEWGEPDVSNLDVDYDFFYEYIWPRLAHRVPAFESCKNYEGDGLDWFNEHIHACLQHRIPAFKNVEVKSAWAGYYDYNTLDQNLIIGNHPIYENFYMACGCSGHGIQQAIGIGKAMADLAENLCSSDCFDLIERFSFDRVLYNEPVYETNIV